MKPHYKTLDEMLEMYDDTLLDKRPGDGALNRPIYKTASQVLADFEQAMRALPQR